MVVHTEDLIAKNAHISIQTSDVPGVLCVIWIDVLFGAECMDGVCQKQRHVSVRWHSVLELT